MKFSVVRLQVQRSPLKAGTAPRRWYEPSLLQQVRALQLTEDGAIGITDNGEQILDVHNRQHPQTRDPKGRAGVTVMAVGDYQQLRARYGDHLVDGIAGESILVDAEPGLAGGRHPESVQLHCTNRSVALEDFRVANPCVEFTRFCLQLPPDSAVDSHLRDTLAALGGGARGYRARVAGAGTVQVGDQFELPES